MNDTPAPARATDKRKQSLYFPSEMLEDIRVEAERQDRSISWLMQHAWLMARDHLRRRQGAGLPALKELEHGSLGQGGVGAAEVKGAQP